MPTALAGSDNAHGTVAVFGGNGTVGLGVVEALVAAGGFDVHAISRRGGPPAGLGGQPWIRAVTWHACDVRDQSSLAVCLNGIAPNHAVVTIGRLRAWDQLFPSRHAAVEDGAKTPALYALRAAREAGATRAVYVSGLFPESLHSTGEVTAPARWLHAWLAPQQRAKAEVEMCLSRIYSADSSLIIRAGLVCGRIEIAGRRVWFPPFTRQPGRIDLLRRLVPHAATVVEIGEACADFLRGQRPGGLLEGGAVRRPVIGVCP